MKRLPWDPTPIILGVVLTSLCFLAVGGHVFLGCLIASFVVPISILTYLTMRSRRIGGGPPTSDISMVTVGLIAAANCTWFVLVVMLTVTYRGTGAISLVMLALTGMSCWLIFWRSLRKDASASGESSWRRLFRLLLTIRGMFVIVALVAVVFWPIHLMRMRPVYKQIANDESVLADLCEADADLMAERARLCRQRSAGGVPWDLNDDDAQTLKICPYPNDGPGQSWLHQAEIWDRASERSRMAAVRHEWTAGWYKPWTLP